MRNKYDLSDFSGELPATMSFRITDKLNGSSQTLPGTVADMPFPFTVPCAATGDTTIGGACTLNTTLDSLVGGAIKESKRSIYKFLDAAVYDTSGNNTVFAGAGLFLP